MNKYAVALLLALLVTLASVTLRKSFASVVGTNAPSSVVAIGPQIPPPPR